MANPIHLGLIGCGRISHRHGDGAKKADQDIRFAACCDVREDAAQGWAEKYGCERVYTDFEEMIRREKLDGVLLATWPNQHREQVERCLAAGARNILCEKALTLTGREAMEMRQIASASKAFLMEGFMYRHHPAIRKLEELVAEGGLGRVDNVRAVFSAYDPETASVDDASRNWRQRKECGGGVVYDYACYTVNACNHFVDSVPKRVFASGSLSETYDTINRFYGMIEYQDGRVGIIESSKKAHHNQEIQISGTNGFLNLPISWALFGTSRIQRRYSEAWGYLSCQVYEVPVADSYQLQLENFAGVIRGEAEPRMPLEESVINTFVLEALVKSMHEGRAVEVEIPETLLT